MIKIYHVPGTRSIRPIWLCYELDLDIEVEPIDFSAAFRASAEWRAISPAGKVPALQDGDLVMVESGAMVDYLLERYDTNRALYPEPGTMPSALYRQWCWMSESTLIRPLGLRRVQREPVDNPAQGLVDAAMSRFREALAMVEAALDGADYLVENRFTAADIMMGYSLGLLRDQLEGYANAQAYVERLTARAAFQRIP